MATTTPKKNKNGLLTFGIIVIVVMLGFAAFIDRQNDTLGERIDSAVDEASDGMENAAEELDPNRTAGEEIGDAIEDAGEEIQDAAE